MQHNETQEHLRGGTTVETIANQSRVCRVLQQEAVSRCQLMNEVINLLLDVVVQHIFTCFGTATEATPNTPTYTETPVCHCESENRDVYRFLAE